MNKLKFSREDHKNNISNFSGDKRLCNKTRKYPMVFIEISGICNAKCPYCAQQRLKQDKHFGNFISAILFEQILDSLFRTNIIDRSNLRPIFLYNWGEPFLNPEINTILQILKKNKLHANISSNFILEPDIAMENLEIISSLTFSLSGFSQSSYEKIHGASLEKVLSNFDSFYNKLRKYSPRTSILISWHRYVFNEKELWDAYKYFKRPGVFFSPTVAYLNDLTEMVALLKGKLPEERRRQAESDLFLSHIIGGINSCSKLSSNYHCPALDCLVIDETGQLLLCCGITRYDSDYILGNVCDMRSEEIWKMKSSNALCKDCISSGLSLWTYEQGLYNAMPWPSGGGINSLELGVRQSSRRFCVKTYLKAEKILLKLPGGRNLLNTLESLGRKIW